jgi:hypothetical protein
VRSVIAIENVGAAINQIAQTAQGCRSAHPGQTRSPGVINASIQKILDMATLKWGVEVSLVELEDIQLPDSETRDGLGKPRRSGRSAPKLLPRRRIDGSRHTWGGVGQ